MELRIYTKSGSLRMVAASGDNDRATSGIQQESLLYLSFTAFECVPIEVYDYVDFAGARYWATERYRPKMTARNEWTYNLQMHGIEGLAAQTLIVNPTDGKDDPLVTLTAPAREHAALIVANLNRKMNTTIWKVGQVVVSEYIHIEYTGKYASDALSELAQAAKTEWWFDGTTLNISRCEFGEPVSLAYGDGLVGGITPAVADGVKFFTRLFPVGSSRNIDPDRYGYARLQLPDRATYVEQDTYLGIVEHYEQEAFAEIYPRRIGLVGSVRHVEKKGEDGEPFTIWYFTDPDIPFNPNDYEIGGLVKQVTFQSGELRGRTFEVNYDAQAKEFEIITQWPYDDEQQLPTPPLVPVTGDEYVLWNIALPESYYTAAEQEFRQAVETFMAESRKDVSVFSAQTDFTVVEARKLDLRPGQRVRIHNTQLFPETGYRDTRIVSISRSVATPGSMNISMSDVLSTGRISRIESDIVRVEQLTRSISTEMPDIIRSWEETPASDSTLYSSRKSEREFLNKRKGGTVEGDVAFGGEIITTDFRAGLIGGAGLGIFRDENGNTVVEADRVNVRQEMQVNTIVINQAEGRGGMEIDTAAYMTVTRVEDTAEGYVCYFDQKNGSVANLFHIDDVAYCQRWTAENVDLKFYKRRVVAVGEDSITLSKTDVNGTGIPAKDDNVIHFGNYTDKTRQYVKVRDVVGGGYERYLDGLDSVNAQGNEYYFVGKQNGLYNEKPRWFIGNKDGEYAEWVDGKLNIKGSISVQSTIGGDQIDEYIKKVSPPVEQEDIEGFVNNIVDPKIEGLQNQIDGVIETWFANGVPTLTNYPASGWNTDALKVQHLGDLYYDNTTGTAYRFSQNAQGGYYWNTITDDAITKALAAAKAAQDTADGKRRIFTAQPTPPYDKGDLWVNVTYPAGTTADTRNPESGKYHNDILRCGTAKASGAAFAISDWGLSSNYTDDTTANKALKEIAGYAYLKEALLDRSTTIGGVFLTSLIRLGQHNESLQTQTVWSGINGIYTKARDISYWAGGDALDLFNDDDTRKTLAEGARPAAALIRMDGSAYFAKGNIGFRADGSGWLGNDVTGIKFSNTGVMTFGSGISFDVSNVSGLNNTLDTLAKFNASLTTLLSPCDANDNEISWAEATMSDNAGGIKAKSLKAKVGLWSVDFVSSKGKNNNEGGGIIGATALAQLTDVSLSTLLNGDVLQFNGQKWVNVAMPTIRPDLTDYVTLNTAQTITAAKTFESIVYRKTNTLTRTLFNSDTGYDYLIFGDTAGYTYLRGSTIGFQNSLGKTNVTIANDGVLTAVKLIKVGGTASQILMADGSVKDFTSMASPYLAVQDVRGEVRLPSYFPAYKVSAWFNSTGTPKDGSWYSGILVKGWANNYASWEIAASAHSPINDENLYFRNGINSTWGGWRKILDENNYASILDDHYVKKTDSIIAAYAGAVRDPEHYTISTRRGSANINFNNDAGLRHFLATSSMMVGKPMNDGHIIHMEWDNSSSWAAQIAVPNSPEYSMQWRAQGTEWGAWRTLLDTSNYADTLDGRYVNKTGDTMTGALTLQTGKDVKLVFDNTDGEKYSRLSFRENGVEYAALTAHLNVCLFDGLSVKAAYFTAESTNLCSNLNADLLDGLHEASFVINKYINDNSVDFNTITRCGVYRINTGLINGPIDSPYGNIFVVNGQGDTVAQMYFPYTATTAYLRTGNPINSSGKWLSWRQFAFTDGNIASASKLANDAAFTAWGQTFFQNGVPRSISGAMTGVGQITATTLAIATTYDNTWSDGTNRHPWYGYDHRFHNTGVYSTTISDFYGITLRTSAGYISMDADGRVGIGTTAPSQKLHVDGNVLVSGDAYYRTEGRAGNSWNNGYGALSVGIMNNSSQTPLLVAYRYNDVNWTIPHANRLFAMELLNSGSVLRFGFGGAAKFYFESDGTFHSENGLWAIEYVSSKGASASSDIRLKKDIEPLTLTLEQIAAAPAARYRWRDTGGVDLGSTAQYWLRILPEGVRTQPNGFYGMAYDKIALVASIMLARKSLDHERRIETLERENRELKRKLNQLAA